MVVAFPSHDSLSWFEVECLHVVVSLPVNQHDRGTETMAEQGLASCEELCLGVDLESQAFKTNLMLETCHSKSKVI